MALVPSGQAPSSRVHSTSRINDELDNVTDASYFVE